VFHPTILTEVPADTRVLQEETFGPLLPVIRVKDAEEAVRRANETPFGLCASVWTGDRRRGERLARRLKAGGVSVNDSLATYAVSSLPFGGVGESGYGRSRGIEGLAEVTRTRSIVVDRLGLRREIWWFPYSRSSETALWAGLLFRWKGGFRGLMAGAWAFLRRRRG
jgi:aldehyde dehydrogenase (NAD+)